MDENIFEVVGFDTNGEPEVRVGDDGSLEVVFNFMPPLDENGNERLPNFFEHFEEVLSEALGVDVLREDREFFLISEPKPDTAARLVAYLEEFWVQQDKT